MTISIQVYTRLAGLFDGRETKAGSIETPTSFVVNGQKEEQTLFIANGANATIYANGLGAFNTLMIESDYNTRAVFTDTESNVFNLGIRGTGKSGKYGVGTIIGLGTTLNAATTINSVVIHNESGSSAKVHGIVVK